MTEETKIVVITRKKIIGMVETCRFAGKAVDDPSIAATTRITVLGGKTPVFLKIYYQKPGSYVIKMNYMDSKRRTIVHSVGSLTDAENMPAEEIATRLASELAIRKQGIRWFSSMYSDAVGEDIAFVVREA